MTASSAADLLLIAVAVLWILTRQVRLGPVKPRLLVLAPLALAYLGLRSMPVAVWKDGADLALLGVAAVASVALGVWRGWTIAVWQDEDGGWWRRGSCLTVALWVTLFAARGLLFVVDRAVGTRRRRARRRCCAPWRSASPPRTRSSDGGWPGRAGSRRDRSRPADERVDGALGAFLAGAFLLPWAVWCSKLAEQRGWIGWTCPAVSRCGPSCPSRWLRWRRPGDGAGWGPLASAHALAGAGALVRGSGRRAAGAAVAAAGVGALLGGSAHLGETLALPAAAAYLVYGTGLFLLTEEAAWRGFALPRLMARTAPGGAGWGVGWHLPTFGLASESDSTVPFAGFAVMTVATSVILAWLYVGSGGSLLLCAVFHAVVDAAYAYTGVVGRDHHAFWVAVVVEVALATHLAVRGGPSLRRRVPPIGRSAGADG